MYELRTSFEEKVKEKASKIPRNRDVLDTFLYLHNLKKKNCTTKSDFL